ncbi:MAG: sigma-70 family RNA polymerase sigma factor [Verrucomicrobiae bacterium]|nr:sigma-70 family RNA polymerase sigma factor [Verrucomicrobiae bacterium]
MARVQAGDTSAFDQLIERYKGRLYATIYHMTSNHEDAADLLQETLIRAFRAMPRFRRDARFSTWAHRIAVNVTINHLRQNKKRFSMSLDQMEMDPNELDSIRELLSEQALRPGDDREEQIASLQKILNEAIQSLSENHRAVVVMHSVQGMTHGQIAEILGIPEGTVKTRLFHAHRLLRKKLARHLKDF